MNKQDRFILLYALLFTLSLAGYVGKAFSNANRKQAPVALPFATAFVIGDSPDFRGSPHAPFTLVEFADYQCPACIAMQTPIQDMLHRHKDQVKYIFHHFPLPMHTDARPAAIAAEAARKQGRFWRMHDLLIGGQGHLAVNEIRAYSKQANINQKQWNSDCAGSAPAAVDANVARGDKLGIHSTPTFLLCCPDGKVVRLDRLDQLSDYVKLSRRP